MTLGSLGLGALLAHLVHCACCFWGGFAVDLPNPGTFRPREPRSLSEVPVRYSSPFLVVFRVRQRPGRTTGIIFYRLPERALLAGPVGLFFVFFCLPYLLSPFSLVSFLSSWSFMVRPYSLFPSVAIELLRYPSNCGIVRVLSCLLAF